MNKEENKYQINHKMKTARDFESVGKLLHAVQIYKNLIENYPEYTEAYFSLADLYEQIGNIDPAISLLKNFLNHDPANNEVRLFLGQYLLRNKKWKAANEVLNFILPEEEPVVSFLLGYSHYKLKEIEIAKTNFLNFIAGEEQSELLQEAYLYLAKIEIELSNFEDALAFAKKAEVLYDNFWELNLIIAVAYFHLGMYVHAISAAEKAKRLNPKESSPREWAGRIYLKLNDFLKAEENFLKYIELTESASSELYTDLGEACFKGKKPKDALAYYEIALRLDPENQSAQAGKKNAASAIEKSKANDG